MTVKIFRSDGWLDFWIGFGVIGFLLVVNILLLLAGNVMEQINRLDHGTDSFPHWR